MRKKFLCFFVCGVTLCLFLSPDGITSLTNPKTSSKNLAGTQNFK
ncbi:MAG: hypothetical protein ACE144_11560 [Thermodesulfobacteriota bacterium]